MVMWTAVRALPLIADNAVARLEAADPPDVPSDEARREMVRGCTQYFRQLLQATSAEVIVGTKPQ